MVFNMLHVDKIRKDLRGKAHSLVNRVFTHFPTRVYDYKNRFEILFHLSVCPISDILHYICDKAPRFTPRDQFGTTLL